MNSHPTLSLCGFYINPQFPGAADQGTGGQPSGPATDPYDRSKPPASRAPGVCGSLTRT